MIARLHQRSDRKGDLSSRSLEFSVGLCFFALLIAQPSAGVDFSPKEMEILKSGEAIRQPLPSSGKDGFYGGSGWSLINAPANEIWEALQDWQSYAAAFPNIVECKPVASKGSKTLLKMRLGHPLIQVLYHVEMRRDDEKKTLYFTMVKTHPTDLDNIKGYWRLFPVDENRTIVAYVLGAWVPSGILNILSDSFKQKALWGLLGVPRHLKSWVEVRAGDRYKCVPGVAGEENCADAQSGAANALPPIPAGTPEVPATEQSK